MPSDVPGNAGKAALPAPELASPRSDAVFHCQVCGSDRPPRQIRDGAYRLAQCTECGSEVLQNKPNAEELTRAYQTSYRTRKDGKRFGPFIEAMIRKFAGGFAREVLRRNPGARRILDIGCGRGELLREFTDLGLEATGTELNQQVLSACRAQGLDVLGCDIAELQPDHSFDIICAIHVLEHLISIEDFLMHASRLAAPGCQLLIEIPNGRSLSHLAFGSAWFGKDLPFHIHQIDPLALCERLRREGWEIEGIDQWSIKHGPFSLGQSLANYCFPRRRNAVFRFLQQPKLQVRELTALCCQLPPMIAGVLAYPFVHLAVANQTRGEIARIWARKFSV